MPSSAPHSPERPAGRLRIAIVDAHPPIREALRLRAEGQIGTEIVGEASSSEEALRLIEEKGPDVAILDPSLEDPLDFELIEALRAASPETSLLVFSVHEETIYAERALRAGASGYLMKTASTGEVLKGARRVAENGICLSQEMVARVVRGAEKSAEEKIRFPVDELTSRELDVFRMLGQGLSLGAIADRLGLTQATVEAHRRKAKEKLGYATIPQAVVHAMKWVQAQKHKEPAQLAR